MQLRWSSLKLHIRTTVVLSVVLLVVLAIVAFFSDRALRSLSEEQENQQALLLATRVANSVENHIKRVRRQDRTRAFVTREWLQIDPAAIEEEFRDTIIPDNPELNDVRLIYRNRDKQWQEIRLSGDSENQYGTPLMHVPTTPFSAPRLIHEDWRGPLRLVGAVAPVVVQIDINTPAQVATAVVTMGFDQRLNYAAKLRSLIWPLIFLAIVAVTLINYFLFRHMIYEPIDRLLAAMSRAEAGDLTAEVPASSEDEIGRLSARFNQMLGRIFEMTAQLNEEQRRLEDRVRDATGEIAERRQQLEEANLRLFDLQRQLTQLERLAAAGQMAAQFAHEVGTPLNLISGHVQLLRARATDERVIKRLDIIAGQIDRITGIVRSMLDSTRRPVARLEPTDLNDLLARIFDAAKPSLASRNVELELTFAEELPPVMLDPEQLQQVVINLVNNSIDAMPEGGSLRVQTRREDDTVVIELADSGEGIAPDQLDSIFDPLYTTKQGRGTGLGLTIVRQIVAEHGGAIEAESQPGEGTTFRIRLPLNRAAGEPLRVSGPLAISGAHE